MTWRRIKEAPPCFIYVFVEVFIMTRTISTKEFWEFLNNFMYEKIGCKSNLIEEINHTEMLIANWNMLRKRYYGALYPVCFSDCEYTAEDIEMYRIRMERALDLVVRKICWLNHSCLQRTGEKFITCYIALKDDNLPNKRENRLQKIALVEDFENLDYAIQYECGNEQAL